MDFMTILGLFAGVLISLHFFPQVIKIRKEKSAKTVSYGMILSSFLGHFLWIIYSFSGKDLPLFLTSLCALIFDLILGWLKFKYK